MMNQWMQSKKIIQLREKGDKSCKLSSVYRIGAVGGKLKKKESRWEKGGRRRRRGAKRREREEGKEETKDS